MVDDYCNVYVFLRINPSAKQLRVKSGKTMVVLSGGCGIATFAEALGLCERQQGKRLQPVVLADLQGEGHVRQRSILADLIFGYFSSRKSN
jgi:hypothetical protein